MAVSPSGALASVSLPRWGNPDGGRHREHRFTATFDGEVSHGGFLLPSGIHVGWDDTGAFIHYDIDAAAFGRAEGAWPAAESTSRLIGAGPFGPG